MDFNERGRLRRKTVSARTRPEALKKLRAVQRGIEAGLPPTDDRLTVGQLLDAWLRDVVPLRVSPTTLANYKSVVETHIKPGLGRKRVSRLNPDDVQRFIRMKLDDGLSTRTVRLLRGVLVQALPRLWRIAGSRS
jgi:integrase